MKLYSLLIAAMLVVAGMSVSCTRTVHNPVDITNGNSKSNKKMEKKIPAAGAKLTYYEFTESGMRWPPAHYVLTKENGKNVLYICSLYKGVCDKVEVPAATYDKVGQLVVEYGMLDFGIYSLPPDMQVLDGYSWRNDIRFDDGTSNYSRGSNAGPDDAGFKAVSEYLDNVAIAAGAKGGLQDYREVFKDF